MDPRLSTIVKIAGPYPTMIGIKKRSVRVE